VYATTIVMANSPYASSNQAFSLSENARVTAVIGTVHASDADVADTLTFSNTNDNSLGTFNRLRLVPGRGATQATSPTLTQGPHTIDDVR
jgi:hypothetical protein